MALMFRRIARNFARNGYFPTDEPTLERVLAALSPSSGRMSILDPCAGEGVAIAEVAHALGRDHVQAFAVEYDSERASHAESLVDRCLHCDLMDTFISRQTFGLLWLNPPYGDLVRDQAGGYTFQGRARLEKLFFQRAFPLLQHDGILILIVPFAVLDKEFVGWITHYFCDVRIYQAVETKFNQVVIFGRRVRQKDQLPDHVRPIRDSLLKIGRGDLEPEALPSEWTEAPYVVPASREDPKHFYRITLEPQQFAAEVHRLRGLWGEFDNQLGIAQKSLRPPVRPLSQWHLALALAAGAISGPVWSKQTGRVFVVRGDTHKEKSLKTEFSEGEDGSVFETRILTDKFVPTIGAWDMTPGSPSRGQLFVIR